MQTFLPYSDYEKSAQSLDYRRLGKQRIEAKQILLALSDPNYGWRHHPAVLMWKNCEYELCKYAIAICKEWIKRGYVDNQLPFFEEKMSKFAPKTPIWMGHDKFHIAHQSNLIKKDSGYYQSKFPGVPNDLPYFWPDSE